MRPSEHRAQAGQAALIMVIFIIVVLSMLLAALAYIAAGSDQNGASAVLSTRAYYAAQSGAEWGTYQLTSATGSTAPKCFGRQSIPFTQPGLSGCSAAVRCTSSRPTSVATATTTSFQVYSVGSCMAGAYSARREIVVGTQVTQNISPPPTPHCHTTCNKHYKKCKKTSKKTYKKCRNTCRHGDKGNSCRTNCKKAYNSSLWQCRVTFNSCKVGCRGGVQSPPTTNLRYWLENP